MTTLMEDITKAGIILMRNLVRLWHLQRRWVVLTSFFYFNSNYSSLQVSYSHYNVIPINKPPKKSCTCRSSVPVTYSPSLFFTELKTYHLSLFITHMTILTLLIPAVHRMHVIHEPCIWSNSPRVLRSSVVRASDQCTEGHWFNSCRGPRFFLCPVLVTCWSHHFPFFFSFIYLYLSY